MVTSVPDPIGGYEARAGALADSYEAARPEQLHDWLEGLHPPAPALVLDVGAGSGRDAAWLAGLGYDVVAVEPSPALRAEAERRHGGATICWMGDQLPALPATLRLGLAFDLVLLSAVWQHVPPADRPRALRKLLGLLRPGGVLAITLRHGPAEAGRSMHPVSLTELETLARQLGAIVVRVQPTPDAMGRVEVSWTGVALRLPDPNGGPVLPTVRRRAPPIAGEVVIDAAFLGGFERLEVPRAVAGAAAVCRLRGVGADCRVDPADAQLRDKPEPDLGRGHAGDRDDLVGAVARRRPAAGSAPCR